MVVVADASPLNILIRCGEARVLPIVYGLVVIPTAVGTELSAPRTPLDVKSFLKAPPSWLRVQAPTNPPGGGAKGLGEREAIALAIEIHADALLIDDLRARRDASALGIQVTGTLGTLQRAAAKGLLELAPSIARARLFGLAVSDDLVRSVLRLDQERRSGQ
ncbi:MAG: DUF3368 domain-containing protein [Phycisphaerales bacterium]